jgi:hypothetical protein
LHTHTHTHLHAQEAGVYTCLLHTVQACVRIYVHAHVHAYMCVCVCVSVCMYVCARGCTPKPHAHMHIMRIQLYAQAAGVYTSLLHKVQEWALVSNGMFPDVEGNFVVWKDAVQSAEVCYLRMNASMHECMHLCMYVRVGQVCGVEGRSAVCRGVLSMHALYVCMDGCIWSVCFVMWIKSIASLQMYVIYACMNVCI